MDAFSLEAEFNQIQHRAELREHDALYSLVIGRRQLQLLRQIPLSRMLLAALPAAPCARISAKGGDEGEGDNKREKQDRARNRDRGCSTCTRASILVLLVKLAALIFFMMPPPRLPFVFAVASPLNDCTSDAALPP